MKLNWSGALEMTLIACFLSHNAAANEIVVWGSNNFGQTMVPTPNSDFIAIAGGHAHTLGLKDDGSIIAWGYSEYGQTNVPAPNTDFIAIAAGAWHSLGLKNDASIVSWGYNGYGQTNVPAPNMGFSAVAAGGGHSLGLKTDGSIVAWGRNDYGQTDVPSPNTDFIRIAAGRWLSIGIKANGSVVAWGYNGYGQTNIPTPNSGFTAVAAGYGHCLGLKTDRSIVAWGRNEGGQTNVPPTLNSDFVAVAAGGHHSLGLKADGTIVAWGSNSSGQTNDPTPNSGFIAITAGDSHSLGLRSIGAIDFETLPNGFPTLEGQGIHDQYASLGVTFDLLHHNTGQHIGYPVIARVGSPDRAFAGCPGEDQPAPGQGVGSAFLTHDPFTPPNSFIPADLLITYTLPVAQASGVLIDVDSSPSAGEYDQFTITARDASGMMLDQVVLTAPPGSAPPPCASTSAGNGQAVPWTLEGGSSKIATVLIRFTGVSSVLSPGVAFDNFTFSGADEPCEPEGDLDGDGDVDLLDFRTMQLDFGNTCE